MAILPGGIRMWFRRKSMVSTPTVSTASWKAARKATYFMFVTLPLRLTFLLLVILHIANSNTIRPLVILIPIAWRWLSLALGLLGTVTVFEVHRRIASVWAPGLEIRDGHELVTAGPYRFVRHPAQSSRLLVTIAIALVSADWLLMVLCAIGVGATYQRVASLEGYLVERFGKDYREYMKRTGCLIPRILTAPRVQS